MTEKECDHIVGYRGSRCEGDPLVLINKSYGPWNFDDVHDEKFKFCPDCGIKLL